MSFEYRLQTGHVSAATIQANAAAVISAFTLTADQPRNLKWAVGEWAQILDGAPSRSLSGRVNLNGKARFRLVISAMTPGMFSAWNVAFFGTTNNDGLVTVQVADNRYTSSARTTVYTGRMLKPLTPEFPFLRGYNVPMALAVPFEIVEATKL